LDPKVGAKFHEDWLKNATAGVSTERNTDRHTDTQQPENGDEQIEKHN